MAIKNTYSVFEFGDEFVCSNFFDIDTQADGVDVSRNDEHLGSIIGISIPDMDADEDEIAQFEKEVIAWVVDNDK